MMRVKANGKDSGAAQYKTAGDYVMVICASAKTLIEAQERLYKIEDGIKVPDKIVRTDIGDRVKKALPKLQKMGFATDWELGKSGTPK